MRPVVPSGGSPDGTGGSSVLPGYDFPNLLSLIPFEEVVREGFEGGGAAVEGFQGGEGLGG